jgi:hypothetical protein
LDCSYTHAAHKLKCVLHVILPPYSIAGSVPLAGLGVGLSIFNTITKFLTVPLVSASTTLVAEAVGADEARDRGAGSRLQTAPSDSETAPLISAAVADVDDTESGQGVAALLLQTHGGSASSSEGGKDDGKRAVMSALEVDSSHKGGSATASSSNAPSSAVASSASAALLIALIFGLMEVREHFMLCYKFAASWPWS